MFRNKSNLCLILIMLLPLFCFGQEMMGSSSSGVATACLFDAVDLSEETESNTEIQQIITDALKIAFEHAGFEVIPPKETRVLWESVAGRLELAEEDRLMGKYVAAAARRAGADIAVTGFYRVEEGTKILLTIKSYGVQPERYIASRTRSGRVGITLHNMINDTVSDILPLLKETAVPPEVATAGGEDEIPLQEVLLLSSDENAELFWAGQESAGHIVDGHLLLTTIRDTSLVVECRKEGYHSRTQVFDMGAEKKARRAAREDEAAEAAEGGTKAFELKPLAKEAVWGTEFSYTLGQTLGLGFGIRYYLKPNNLFIGGEDYFFLQKALGTGSSPVFHNDFRFLLGRYVLFPPTSWFRIGISTGLGVVISRFNLPDMPLYTDFYINFINWWLELNMRNWAFYLRQEGRFMLGVSNHLLPTGWHSELPWGIPITFGIVKKWQTR